MKKKHTKNTKNNRKKTNFSDLTIIIPTLNEEENVKIIIKRIFRLYPNVNVVIVDDNSIDRTIQNIKELMKKYKKLRLLVKHSGKKGITGSLINGINHSKTEFLIFMDADLQHPVKSISKIYDKLKRGRCDLVVGVRRDDSGLGSFKRRIISRTARLLMATKLLFFGIHCRDPVSGFFGIRRDLISYSLKRFNYLFEYTGYKILSDILNVIIKSGRSVVIGEVVYDFKRRRFGDSKLRKKHIISFIKTLFK